MSRNHRSLSKNTKRVSFDDSARFNFEAPRSSLEGRTSVETPYHTPDGNKDESDDEIDNLLSDDPLYSEKDVSRKRILGGKGLSRKKRRILIFGFVTLFLGLFAALATFGVLRHAQTTSNTSMSDAEAKAALDQSSIAEVEGMTEVPSLVGILPLENPPTPISPVPVVPVTTDETSDEETALISVPATDINWDNEEADKAVYEAEIALAAEEDALEPMELSPEAVAQAQGVNAQLDEASAEVASTMENSADKIEGHRLDPVQSVVDAANDFWAWFDAVFKDLVSNDADNADSETVY